MRLLSRIRFNLSEASTKRGLALFIASGIATWQMIFGDGGEVDINALAHRAEFWLAIGAQLSGIIGMFLPDEPKTVKMELPPPVAPVFRGRLPHMDDSPESHIVQDRGEPSPPPGFNNQ